MSDKYKHKTDLTEYEKICFGCTEPVEKCGTFRFECDYTRATKHNRKLRYKTTLKYPDTCGFKEKED